MKYTLYLVISLVIIFTGCATFGTYETARVAPRGGVQGGGAITPAHISTTEDIWGNKAVGFLFYPYPEGHVKFGVSDNFDLGIRWPFGPGATFTSKYQFLKGQTDAAVSLSSSLFYYTVMGMSVGYVTLEPRFIISSESPESFPFSVNAGLNTAFIFAGAGGVSGTGTVLTAVGGVGLPFLVGANRSFRIMPELSAQVPLWVGVSAGGVSEGTSILGSFSMSLGVGFTYTGPYEESGYGRGGGGWRRW